MAIADKLLELNDVKQDIKIAIEGKGVSMTGVPFNGYPAKINSITTGTGTEPGMSYHDYAKTLYSMWGYVTQFSEAWTESQNSLNILFEIPLMLVAPNQDFAGKDLDLYVGTDSALTNFYNLVASGEFPNKYAIVINKSVIRYQGDISSSVGMPFPVYAFGLIVGDIIDSPALIDEFLIADLTPLGMGLGIALAKIAGTVIPDNSITIRRGFESYEAGLIIPEMIETVGLSAFYNFNKVGSNPRIQVPYIIGPNVKYIGHYAFQGLEYQLPLIIPDSVEWIGTQAFIGSDIVGNYIIIPESVTHIGETVFGWDGNDIIVIMYSEVPPVLVDLYDFPPFPNDTVAIYVPDNAVNAYKSAWTEFPVNNYPDKIKAMSSLPSYDGHAGNRGTAVELTQAQYDALSAYNDNTYYLIVEE